MDNGSSGRCSSTVVEKYSKVWSYVYVFINV